MIDRGELFAGSGLADDNFRIRDPPQVKRVEWLATFEKHVVGDVDHIVDGLDTDRRQSLP